MEHVKLFPWSRNMYNIINKVYPSNIDVLNMISTDGFHIESKYTGVPGRMIMALIDEGYRIDTNTSYADVVKIYGNDEETRGLSFTFSLSEIDCFDTICVVRFFDEVFLI